MKRLVPSHMYGDYEAQLRHFTRVRSTGCWEFVGYILPTGYGQLARNVGAHRMAWEIANGRPIPDGLVIDHLCHNANPLCNDNAECIHRRCVNPDHLEAVTSAVNVLRGHGFASVNAAKEFCDHGHEYTVENTYWNPSRFGRQCRECRRRANAGRQRPSKERAARSKAMRAWAVSVGFVVADRGKLRAEVVAAYAAAHEDMAA